MNDTNDSSTSRYVRLFRAIHAASGRLLTRSERVRWMFPVCVAVAAILATVLSFFMGRNQSIWFDEGYSLLICGRSWRDMLALTAVDVHPPLYYVALKLWMNLVGGDVPLMRLLGCLFLGACIAAMALLLRRMFGTRVTMLCLPVLTVGVFALRFGYELRMYSLASLLSVFGTYALLRAVDDSPMFATASAGAGKNIRVDEDARLAANTTGNDGFAVPEEHTGKSRLRWWVIYGVIVALGMYTLYLTALIWMTHVIWLTCLACRVVHRSRASLVSVGGQDRREGVPKRYRAWRWVFVYVFSVILYVPWMPFLINQMSHPALPPVTRQLNMAQMASIYSAMMVGLPEKNIPALVSLILMCIVAGIAVLLAKFHFRSSLTGRSLSMLSLLYALFGFPVMSMALYSSVKELIMHGSGFFSIRYCSLLCMFFYAALAAIFALGIAYRGNRKSVPIRSETTSAEGTMTELHVRIISAVTYAITLAVLTAGVASLWSLGNFNYDSSSVPASRQLSSQVTCSREHPVVAVNEYAYIEAAYYYRDCRYYRFYDSGNVSERGGYAPLRGSGAQLRNVNDLTGAEGFTLLTNRKTMYGGISSDQFIRDSIIMEHDNVAVKYHLRH